MSTKILVDKEALSRILNALLGPAHYIRELQVTRTPTILFPNNPINILVDDYINATTEPENDKPTQEICKDTFDPSNGEGRGIGKLPPEISGGAGKDNLPL